jgi:pimeloyl-ACP methyl ester carboxylesterase
MFKTPAGEAEFMACYDAALAQWPVPYASMHLPTRYGSTHVLTCGPDDGPALVLLHAAGTSLTEWIHNIAALSHHHRTFLVDICGDPNKSVWSAPFRSRADAADWLSDVLDGLKLERASLVGHSYGGWMALNFALANPGRVERLALLAPAAAFAKFSLAFFVHFLGPMIFPSRNGVHNTFRWLSATREVIDERLAEQMFLAVRHFQFAKGGIYPTVFSDEELRGLHVPTLLLVGEHEVIYDPRRVLDRAVRVVPGIQAALLRDVGHLLNIERPDAINQRILTFLDQPGSQSSAS